MRRCVDEGNIKTVVIDSINGYQAAMPEENALVLHMHELLLYLNRKGAATFMTVAQHGLVGDMQAPVDITYLADTVILLRYFEAIGKVRRAISIIKKRTGNHESTIREFRISGQGMTIGEPLEAFQGVLRAYRLTLAPAIRCCGKKPCDSLRFTAGTGADSRAHGPRQPSGADDPQ